MDGTFVAPDSKDGDKMKELPLDVEQRFLGKGAQGKGPAWEQSWSYLTVTLPAELAAEEVKFRGAAATGALSASEVTGALEQADKYAFEARVFRTLATRFDATNYKNNFCNAYVKRSDGRDHVTFGPNSALGKRFVHPHGSWYMGPS